MKTSSWSLRCVVTACVSFGILAGCGGSQLQTGSPLPSQGNSGSTVHSLLYVTNYRNSNKADDVYVYSYPTGTLEGHFSEGTLDGIGGLCSDEQGDVFIPVAHEILEYAHGGVSPIATLHNTHPSSGYCAVDPTTGNLAAPSFDHGKSAVAIYSGAKGQPKFIVGGKDGGSGFDNQSCTYDNAGDLFVEGITGSFGFGGIVELRKGGQRLRPVQWNGGPPHVSSIQWDGHYLAVLSNGVPSYEPATVYRYSVSGRQATLVGTVKLEGAGYVGQFWIEGTTIVVPSLGRYGSGLSAILFYDYPAGGNPTKVLVDNNEPFGATVSLAPSRT